MGGLLAGETSRAGWFTERGPQATCPQHRTAKSGHGFVRTGRPLSRLLEGRLRCFTNVARGGSGVAEQAQGGSLARLADEFLGPALRVDGCLAPETNSQLSVSLPAGMKDAFSQSQARPAASSAEQEH